MFVRVLMGGNAWASSLDQADGTCLEIILIGAAVRGPLTTILV